MSNNIKKNLNIILKRNYVEEVNFECTKTYNLSEIDTLSNITQEQKIQLLKIIKKILLCTNRYIDIAIFEEFARYTVLNIAIFLFYAIIFSPFYKYFKLSDQEAKNISPWIIFEQVFYYVLTEMLEIILRFTLDIYQRYKVNKMMLFYAKNELKKNDTQFSIKINSSFDLKINKSPSYKNNNYFRNLFYEYVINYPNVRYYRWTKNLLTDIEVEISKDIINNLDLAEDTQISKNYMAITFILLLYLISFKYLIVCDYSNFFFYKLIIFFFAKIISFYISKNIKKSIEKIDESLNRKYISKGYFIFLKGPLIQIYKLKEQLIEGDKAFTQEKYKFFQNKIKYLDELI